MVTHERLIKIPVPDFNKTTTHKLDLDAFCLCYQFDLGDHGYGPYGFETEKAEEFIKKSFPNLYFFDKERKELIEKERVDMPGVYLFENHKELKSHLEKYKVLLKKNEILLRKGLSLNESKEKPLLWDVYEGDKISSSVLTGLNSIKCGFFIVNNYLPEGGKSLIFLNDCYLNRINLFVKELNLKFDLFPSIDSLKSW